MHGPGGYTADLDLKGKEVSSKTKQVVATTASHTPLATRCCKESNMEEAQRRAPQCTAAARSWLRMMFVMVMVIVGCFDARIICFAAEVVFCLFE